MKLSKLDPNAQPEWSKDGIPMCLQTGECPSYDGKRCRVIGVRPSYICEPAVIAMAEEITRLNVLGIGGEGV